MAQLQKIDLDFSRAARELAEFKKFLQDNTTFPERNVVVELKKRPHLSCLIGFLQPSVPRANVYKFEFQIQGVFRADLVVGNLQFKRFVPVEFESGEDTKYAWSIVFQPRDGGSCAWFLGVNPAGCRRALSMRLAITNIGTIVSGDGS